MNLENYITKKNIKKMNDQIPDDLYQTLNK